MSSLSEEQRKSFRLFLESPYLNSNGRLLRFLDILAQDKDAIDTGASSPEVIWQKGLSQGPFHKNGFDKICSELLAALTNFLGLEVYMQQNELRFAHQFEAYVDGGLDEWVPGLFKTFAGKKELFSPDSVDGMYAKMHFLRNQSVYQFRQPRAPHGESLLEIDKALTEFFLAQKLEIASALANYNQLFPTGLELGDKTWMVEILENRFDEFSPFIRLHYLGFLTVNGSEAHFLRLKSELALQREQLAEDDGMHLYRLALNFCYFKLNEGEDRFEQEIASLLLELLETKWLLKEGQLIPEQFKNIVTIQLRQGETSWVRNFIDEWEGRLSDDHGGAAIVYNRAVLAFFESRHTDSLLGMEQVLDSFKADVFYGLDARLYQIKALYERNLPDDSLGMESKLNSFRVYVLRNNKVGKGDQEHYKSFVKLCRRLMVLRGEVGEKRQKKIEKFLSGLSSLRPVSNRSWFIKMANELKNA